MPATQSSFLMVFTSHLLSRVLQDLFKLSTDRPGVTAPVPDRLVDGNEPGKCTAVGPVPAGAGQFPGCQAGTLPDLLVACNPFGKVAVHGKGSLADAVFLQDPCIAGEEVLGDFVCQGRYIIRRIRLVRVFPPQKLLSGSR